MTVKSISRDGEFSLGITEADDNVFGQARQYPLYTIFFIRSGSGVFKADFALFQVEAPAILFSTPLQTIRLEGDFRTISMLQFHGDYYCIEYHKKEVACNGVLFNNIYEEPFISLRSEEAEGFGRIIDDLHEELSVDTPADPVITAYLQLFLAKATSIKTRRKDAALVSDARDEKMEQFRALIDKHYLEFRKPSDYAALLHVSSGTLTRRCKQYFRKSPTHLIQERIIQEAKKHLHLSRRSVKEIAHALNFQDEHYFSRFFKKVTKVSPQTFRLKTGISIVADLSMSNPE